MLIITKISDLLIREDREKDEEIMQHFISLGCKELADRYYCWFIGDPAPID
jgi:hypothetical protein